MDEPGAGKTDAQLQADLMVVAHMFMEYRTDPIMRELCRLAVKCAQERLLKPQS